MFFPNLNYMVFGYKIKMWFSLWDSSINEVWPQVLMKQFLHTSSPVFFIFSYFIFIVEETDQNNLHNFHSFKKQLYK